jgi:hypothetical protein
VRRRTAIACLLAIAAGGCGSVADSSDGPTVTERVTREFGHRLLSSQDAAPLADHRTAMQLLREGSDVGLSSLGGHVAAIEGLQARNPSYGSPNTRTWALIVNGIESDTRPAEYRLHPGDVVQWDYRYWYVTLDVRATVGAFPETFTRGVFGRRFPVTVECERQASQPCKQVKGALRRAGVPTDGSRPDAALPERGLPRRAKILVGRWRHWRDRPWPRRIDRGPQFSGVFARFDPRAERLRLLNWFGDRQEVAGAGTGLVAAMRPSEEDLLWVVTGVDDLGVARAARALNRRDLRDAFAIAVTSDDQVERLPLAPPSR